MLPKERLPCLVSLLGIETLYVIVSMYVLLEEVQTDKATNGHPLATGVETQQLEYS